MEFGKTLRTAREAKGYSTTQLAEMTHLAPSVVSNLEQENFSSLPAPIYGRGFVKLYCEAVGLEPKPLVDAFMEAFSGQKAAPDAIPEPPPPAEPLKKGTADVAEAEVAPPPPQQDLFTAPPADREPPSLSRYATPLRDIGQNISSAWRIGLLAAGGAIVLALLVWGLCALRRTTAPSVPPEQPAAATVPAEQPVTAAVPPTSPKDSPSTAKKPRTPQEIPALYLY